MLVVLEDGVQYSMRVCWKVGLGTGDTLNLTSSDSTVKYLGSQVLIYNTISS